MADFYKAIQFTSKYEGGEKFTDDPLDRGGATRWGVSLRFAEGTNDLALFDLDKDGKITKNDIKLLDKDTAYKVYKKYFWDIAKLDELSSDKKAFIFFDAIVNHGLRNATGMAQRALIDLGFKIGFDRLFGRQTFGALEEVDEEKFIYMFLEKRKNFFEAIVKNDPSQNRFIKGWLNRIEWCRRDVRKL